MSGSISARLRRRRKRKDNTSSSRHDNRKDETWCCNRHLIQGRRRQPKKKPLYNAVAIIHNLKHAYLKANIMQHYRVVLPSFPLSFRPIQEQMPASTIVREQYLMRAMHALLVPAIAIANCLRNTTTKPRRQPILSSLNRLRNKPDLQTRR